MQEIGNSVQKRIFFAEEVQHLEVSWGGHDQ